MLRPRDPRVVPAAAQSRFRQRMILPGANSTDSLLLTQEGKTMISWDFFSVANNLGDSVAFNLESDKLTGQCKTRPYPDFIPVKTRGNFESRRRFRPALRVAINGRTSGYLIILAGKDQSWNVNIQDRRRNVLDHTSFRPRPLSLRSAS